MILESGGGLWGVGGYALGTLQILIIDWVHTRKAHQGQLRLIRAELRRLEAINKKFEWRDDGPGADVLPKPPDLTTTFLQAVATADFYITDEHDDDNTQQGLLELTDACTVLQYHWKETVRRADETKKENDGKRRIQLWIEAKELADAYDEIMDRFQILVSTALSDMDRRMREASLLRQLNRPMGKLREGRNPPSLPDPSFARKD